jgi:hypothetical protein
MEVMDEQEEDWLEHLNVMKSRGKGAPKKKRTAAGEMYPNLSASGRFTDFLQNRRNSTRGDDESLRGREVDMSDNAWEPCISCTSHSIPEGVWAIHFVCTQGTNMKIDRLRYADTPVGRRLPERMNRAPML